MTTILHAADLHQGILTHSRPDPATGIPSRILDLADAWRKVVDVALENDVDAVILAGDVFHTANPGATEIALFAAELRRLSSIEVVIIPGNHDRAPHSGRRSVLEAFHDGRRVYVRTEPTTQVLRSGLEISCLPSVSRMELAAAGDVLRPEADEAVVDTLRQIVSDLARTSPSADVLTLHYSIAGGILGSEKDLAIIAEPMLSPADLEGPWGYVAAGHIHRRQIFETVPPPTIAYAGSVAPLTFGEEGAHGVVVVELGGEVPIVSRFVSIESRPLLTLKWNADLEPPEEGAIVRVTNVPHEAMEDTRAGLENEGAWIVKLEEERLERMADVLAAAEDMPSTREALEAWLGPRVPDETERRRVLELADNL